jgi:hypothetical protein
VTVDIDVPVLVRQITDEKVGRMASLDMSDREFDENAGILYDFNYIAANMLKEEPGIDMPGAPQPIPTDEAVIRTILSLFSEGVCFAMGKCLEMGITGEPKKTILQNMALEVYNQAKQIIACTYGQEHTPNFQFSPDQQITMINQAAEGHLMYFIGEYEKEHGPILIEENRSYPSPPVPEPTESLPALPSAPPLPVQIPDLPENRVPSPTPPGGNDLARNREKYAAVALLLTTLNPSQRTRILKNFSAEEKAWIVHYSELSRIRAELDFKGVQAHLKHFKEWLTQNRGSSKTPAGRQLSKLAGQFSREKLLSWVSEERSGVQRYLDGCYEKPTAAVPPWRSSPTNQFRSDNTAALPPKVEDILYRYLSRRIESEQGAPASGSLDSR